MYLKKILFVFILLASVFMLINETNAISTYIGLKITNLTDDPAASCAGQSGFGTMGRIKAISSITPNWPIYINITRASDDNPVWDGDITKDCSGYSNGCDYTVGDIIFIPDSVDLTSGVNYNLFMDIDAIRIYLPIGTRESFSPSVDQNYWTIGRIPTATANEWYQGSTSTCGYDSATQTTDSRYLFFVANLRTVDLDHACMHDGTSTNCDENRLMGIKRSGSTDDFNINYNYDNLQDADKGNLYLGFKFP